MSAKRFEGPAQLDQETGRRLRDDVAAHSVSKGDAVVIDLAETESMDSRGGAWLVQIAGLIHAKQADFRIEGQRGRVAEFVDLVGPGLTAPGEVRRRRMGLLEASGDRVCRYSGEFKDFLALIVDSVYWTFIAPLEGRGFRWGLLIDEIHEMGVRGVRINCLMNFLLGLIIAMLSAAQLEQFGATIYVADLIIIAFTRELAAIMTAVVVSARTGAAIAAELSTMKVQEEIDALRGMGLNVAQFLIAPKLLALLIVMPCLVALGMLSGLVGGALWGIGVMGVDQGAWWRETIAAAAMDDVCQGMLKAMIFAVTIVLVGCHNGLRVSGGARGVGLMTTRAVVMDIFFIIVIDMVFAVTVYYVLNQGQGL